MRESRNNTCSCQEDWDWIFWRKDILQSSPSLECGHTHPSALEQQLLGRSAVAYVRQPPVVNVTCVGAGLLGLREMTLTAVSTHLKATYLINKLVLDKMVNQGKQLYPY